MKIVENTKGGYKHIWLENESFFKGKKPVKRLKTYIKSVDVTNMDRMNISQAFTEKGSVLCYHPKTGKFEKVPYDTGRVAIGVGVTMNKAISEGLSRRHGVPDRNSRDGQGIITFQDSQKIIEVINLMQEIVSDDGKYMSYEEAVKFNRNNGIRTKKQYMSAIRSGETKLPEKPWIVYFKDWKGVEEFFSLDEERATKPKYNAQETLSSYARYVDAKAFLARLGLKTRDDYYATRKAGKLPDNLPARPDRVYVSTGEWMGWGHFLSTKAAGDVQAEFGVTPLKKKKYMLFILTGDKVFIDVYTGMDVVRAELMRLRNDGVQIQKFYVYDVDEYSVTQIRKYVSSLEAERVGNGFYRPKNISQLIFKLNNELQMCTDNDINTIDTKIGKNV